DANRTLMVYDTTAPVGEMLPVSSESSFVFASDGDKTFKVVGDNSEVVFPEDSNWGSTVEAKLKTPESPDYGRTEVVARGFRLLKKDTDESFHDPGVKFSDNAKGLDESDITVEHTELAPDAGVDKQYRITYKAQDAFGNLSTVYERIIKVLSGPRVTLLGESEIVVVNKYNQTESIDYAGTGYTDQGASAKDALGVDITHLSPVPKGILVTYSYFDASTKTPDSTFGNISHSLSDAKNPVKTPIDLTKTGKYEIFYMATDENLNQSPFDERELPEKSRIVYSVANDTTLPTVTPRRGTENGGVWEVTLDVNATGSGTYAELGATARKTRHAGLGFPYEVPQSWDENNASSIGTVTSLGDVPFVFGKGVGTAVEKSWNDQFPFQVEYSISDEFGNSGTATLRVRMQDLIKPSIVPDAFAGGATDSVTIEANASYVDPGFTASDNYYSNEATGWSSRIDYYSQTSELKRTITDYAKDGSDTSHDASTIKTWDLTNFGKFYVRYTLSDPSGNTADFNRTITVIDTTGPIITLVGPDGSTVDADPLILLQNIPDASSTYTEYGVNVTDNSMVGSQSFPTTQTPITVAINSTVNMDVPGQYKVTYTAEDSSGNVSTLERTVDVLDREKPTILGDTSLQSSSPPDFPYVIAEGGVQYDDDSGQTVRLWNGSDFNSMQVLSLYAKDVQDGTITAKIKRTISFSEDGSSFLEPGFILNNDVASVPSLIDTSFDRLDTQYLIKYEVADLAENNATEKYRRIIVKDTMAPSIQPSSSETTVLVDYKSTANPDVRSLADVKNFLVNGFSAVDANNFDPNLTWVVDFQKTTASGEIIDGTTYVVGEIFPATRNDDGPGYKITIKVSDSSGNVSDEVVRYLKVGDFTPPTLTMMGKSEIHDFFRFGQNTTLNDNATGFGGGAHRMMLAEYNFTDPGVYAEDENADWALSKGNPDLNGNGVGEGFATVRKSDRADMDTCSDGAGLIHVYSFIEKNMPDSQKIKYWQGLMGSGDYGYNTSLLPDVNSTLNPAKVPDVEGEGYDFNDLNKTDLTNFDLTQITIEYRVKDHWDNYSAIATRLVYFYESRQFGSYAFYATPITDASGGAFEDYDNNGTTGNPSLSGARKDTDGDGVSDFWEFALGTNPERVGVPGADDKYTPEFTDPLTFQNTLGGGTADLSISKLTSNLSKMNAASRLISVRGIGDFNATGGL
ncbi:MAG: DUF5011 domain-containing protein, partial [Verrucomicrobia bacterium]|nr:DUF5011 domain-containing protein [Verrucomicrobiota bacterium]